MKVRHRLDRRMAASYAKAKAKAAFTREFFPDWMLRLYPIRGYACAMFKVESKGA